MFESDLLTNLHTLELGVRVLFLILFNSTDLQVALSFCIHAVLLNFGQTSRTSF